MKIEIVFEEGHVLNSKKGSKTWMLGKETLSNELRLLLLLTSNIYKIPKLQHPKTVNLGSFARLASENKICHYALTELIRDNRLEMDGEFTDVLRRLKKEKDMELLKFQRTLETIDEILKGEEYLLLDSYKSCPYVTADVDFIVKNLERAVMLLGSNGFTLIVEFLPGIHFVKEGLLIVEFCDEVAWGSLDVVDNELVWRGDREVVIDGIEVRLPSIEGDLLSIIAHTNFQFYQLTLTDLLYIYRSAPMADWTIMARQAKKYRWLGAFYDTVSIINGLHRKLYHEPSPIETFIPLVAQVEIQLPYIYSGGHVARALMTKGVHNLTKLPSYLGDRLKKTSYSLHRAYCEVILGHVIRPWVRYGPISYAGPTSGKTNILCSSRS